MMREPKMKLLGCRFMAAAMVFLMRPYLKNAIMQGHHLLVLIGILEDLIPSIGLGSISLVVRFVLRFLSSLSAVTAFRVMAHSSKMVEKCVMMETKLVVMDAPPIVIQLNRASCAQNGVNPATNFVEME